MLGMVNRTRRGDKQRTSWQDNIKTNTKMNILQLKETVFDKVAWRVLAYSHQELDMTG